MVVARTTEYIVVGAAIATESSTADSPTGKGCQWWRKESTASHQLSLLSPGLELKRMAGLLPSMELSIV